MVSDDVVLSNRKAGIRQVGKICPVPKNDPSLSRKPEYKGQDLGGPDDDLRYLWVDDPKCPVGQACWQATFSSENGCERGLYVEANIYDDNGTIIDWTNDTVPALGPDEDAKLTFGTFEDSATSIEIVDWSCRN